MDDTRTLEAGIGQPTIQDFTEKVFPVLAAVKAAEQPASTPKEKADREAQ